MINPNPHSFPESTKQSARRVPVRVDGGQSREEEESDSVQPSPAPGSHRGLLLHLLLEPSCCPRNHNSLLQHGPGGDIQN